VGLRVADVTAAADLYRGLGFEEMGRVPDADGRPVFILLERGEVRLLVDALQGMPFPDTERERRIRQGPRGLGVTIGLRVNDLEAAYAYCLGNGCEITCEPMNEAWGDRIFECVDPFGYLWEFFTPSHDLEPAAGLAATRDAWFGGRS
jgi:uncharacterized glyoxalase superfamily protein PhnB